MPEAGGSRRGSCHTEACAIQDCLANNGYDMSKCQDKVDKLKRCCSNGVMQESVHCAFLNSVPGTDSGESQSPDDQVSYAMVHCSTGSIAVYTIAASNCMKNHACRKVLGNCPRYGVTNAKLLWDAGVPITLWHTFRRQQEAEVICRCSLVVTVNS